MSPPSLEALTAHELGHVRKRDAVRRRVVQALTILTTAALLTPPALLSITYLPVAVPFVGAPLGTLSLMVQLGAAVLTIEVVDRYAARRRELRAQLFAARLVGPKKVIDWEIENDRVSPEHQPLLDQLWLHYHPRWRKVPGSFALHRAEVALMQTHPLPERAIRAIEAEWHLDPVTALVDTKTARRPAPDMTQVPLRAIVARREGGSCFVERNPITTRAEAMNIDFSLKTTDLGGLSL